MSADQWSPCPRCVWKEIEHLDQRQANVDLAYGKVSVEDFDQMRADLAHEREVLANAENTFREDWKISGAEEGSVTVKYNGQCIKCGLALKFEEDHPIPGLS